VRKSGFEAERAPSSPLPKGKRPTVESPSFIFLDRYGGNRRFPPRRPSMPGQRRIRSCLPCFRTRIHREIPTLKTQQALQFFLPPFLGAVPPPSIPFSKSLGPQSSITVFFPLSPDQPYPQLWRRVFHFFFFSGLERNRSIARSREAPFQGSSPCPTLFFFPLEENNLRTK